MAKYKGLKLIRKTILPRKCLKAAWCQCYICEDDEDKELQCPECGCPKIVFEENTDDFSAGHMYLGLQATCYECGHEFTVTENCWRVVMEGFEDRTL